MATNLLELITDAIGSQITSQASSYLGESEKNTGSALSMLLPALLGGLTKQGSTADGAASLLKTLNGSDVDTSLLGNLAGLFSGGSRTDSLVSLGTQLVGSLFGEKAGTLASTVASLTGLKSSSSSNLLYMAAPLILSFLKKLVTSDNLDAKGLMSLLGDQKGFLRGKIDKQLSGALGLGSFFDENDSIVRSKSSPERVVERDRKSTYVAPPVEEESSIWSKILPWLVVLGGLGAALAMFRGCDKTQLQDPVSAPAAPAAVEAPAVPAVAPAAEVAAPPAIQPEVVDALPAKVYFDVGSNKINAEGTSSISKAAASIKQLGLTADITGYTDKTGDVAANAELAKQRALAVHHQLISEGVPESKLILKPPFAITTTGSGDNAEARRVEISKAN